MLYSLKHVNLYVTFVTAILHGSQIRDCDYEYVWCPVW